MPVLRAIINQTPDYINDPNFWVNGGATAIRKTTSGELMSPERATTLTTYFACMRVVAEDVSKPPLKVYRDNGDEGREYQKDHPVNRLLNKEPNPEMTAVAFRECMTSWAGGWGGGIAEIERDGAGRPMWLWPIHPSRVEIKRDDMDRMYYLVRNDKGAPSALQPYNVLHIPGLSRDGINGYAIAVQAYETLGLGYAARAFGAAFFGNGASLGSIIEFPGVMKAEAKENFRRSWREAHQGAARAGGFALLENGMKYTQLGIPPEQAQFLETRQFERDEICAWWRVNPNKVQNWLRTTFNNVEAADRSHADDTCGSWYIRWEQEVNRKLFLPTEKDLYVRHVVNALKRGDMAARSEFYRKMFDMGAYTANTILAKEEENPIGPQGDVHWVAVNMMPVERALEAPAQAPRLLPEPEEKPKEKTKMPDMGPTENTDGADEKRSVNLRPVVVSEVKRMLSRETKAIGRAIVKADYSDWLERFGAEHRIYIVEHFQPIYEAVAGVDRAEILAKLFADQHIVEAVTRAQNESAETIERWATGQAETITEQFYQFAI